jgi:hypothetical protein
MTILEALDDPHLLAAAFPDGGSWTAWRAFLAALYGLPMTADQAAIFRRHTGREVLPTAPAREAWLAVGRRGGKSRVAALAAVYLAAFRDYRTILAPGEVGTLPIVAADRRQSRAVMGYVVGLLDSVPMLRQLVVHRTAESIELSTRCRIEIHTASWRALRGYTVVGAVLDEVAFWRSENSANPDVEIVNALRPAMATVPGALLLAISSPYARRGVLWEQYRRHYGQAGDVLVWQAPTQAMNPKVPAAVIANAYAEDEASAAAEYGAEFRRDLEAFVSREVLDACIVPGRLELPPVSGVQYRAFVDPSGGSQDSFTLGIAHQEARDGAVLDRLVEYRPPFSPEQVVTQCCAVLETYAAKSVTGDRYAGEWAREPFRKGGVDYQPSAAPKSDLYRDLLPLLNSGRVELLEQPRLQAQLLRLERRISRAGKDSIDHAPGGHDDVANAAAGALVACVGPSEPYFLTWMRNEMVRTGQAHHDIYQAEVGGAKVSL